MKAQDAKLKNLKVGGKPTHGRQLPKLIPRTFSGWSFGFFDLKEYLEVSA